MTIFQILLEWGEYFIHHSNILLDYNMETSNRSYYSKHHQQLWSGWWRDTRTAISCWAKRSQKCTINTWITARGVSCFYATLALESINNSANIRTDLIIRNTRSLHSLLQMPNNHRLGWFSFPQIWLKSPQTWSSQACYGTKVLKKTHQITHLTSAEYF